MVGKTQSMPDHRSLLGGNGVHKAPAVFLKVDLGGGGFSNGTHLRRRHARPDGSERFRLDILAAFGVFSYSAWWLSQEGVAVDIAGIAAIHRTGVNLDQVAVLDGSVGRRRGHLAN